MEFQRSAKDFAEAVMAADSHENMAALVQSAMDQHANQFGCRWADDALERVKAMPAFAQLCKDVRHTKSAQEIIELPSFRDVALSLEYVEVCAGTNVQQLQ